MSATEALVELIDLFRGERRYNRKLTDAALTAISYAIVATRAYEARVKTQENCMVSADQRDREEEVRIGGLWQTAAIKTRNISSNFADRLNEKALYWFLDFPWTADQVISKRIDWSSIDNEVQKLLRHGS